MKNTKIKSVTVPNNFYKNKAFPCDKNDLRVFLTALKGYVSDTNDYITLEDLSIEDTVRYHTGDCRLWFKNGGGYDVMFAKQMFMAVDEKCYDYMEDIFDWMEFHTPTLYKQHKELYKN